VDPSLTTLGENEAVSAQAITSSLAPKLLVTSPLRRAVQTARIAFKRVWADPAVPKVAHESAREGYGTGNVYDMRRPAAEVAAEFDNVVDFTQIQPGARDAMFEAGETDAGLVARGADMMQWLAGREEDEIAVVCHSKFLFALMNGVVEAPEGSLLRGWFDTAEVRSVDCYVVKAK
jgi:broad specificity phosphatase PhoE